MPHSIRPGDLLAGRYRLVDLLSESGSGRFWRAHDRILERHVALHVISAEDPRAEGLLRAARRSATVLDPHILRVLDAEEVDGLCYVVNEWGTGTSLDIMLGAGGVLSPRRAAWLVAEVGAAATVAHAAGVAHGRLNPENVLVDLHGSIRVIGWCVDAALHGRPESRVEDDVDDLAGLLYAALTGRWAGASDSAVVSAPREHGRVLRPRQVRAGIPRQLDVFCDEVLDLSGRGRGLRAPESARGLTAALEDFVGDPTGIPESLVERLVSRGSGPVRFSAVPELGLRPADEPEVEPTRVVRAEDLPRDEPTVVVPTPEPAPSDEPAASDVPASDVPAQPDEPTVVTELPSGDPDTNTDTEADTDTEAEPVEGPDAAEPTTPADGRQAASSVDLPTEAGLPSFDEQEDRGRRQVPGPPPPPLEEPTPRPLFAPEPPEGTPVRRARPGAASTATGAGDYWPWDTGTGHGTGVGALGSMTHTGSGLLDTGVPADDDQVPGRSTFRLAALLLAGVLLVVAVAVAFNLGRGRTPLGSVPDDEASPTAGTSATASATPEPLTGLSVTDLDPQADPPEENPELTPLTVDGDPATSWRTSTYRQDLGPAGLKTGVGLVVDLGDPAEVRGVELDLVGEGSQVQLFVTDEAPSGVADLEPVADVSAGTQESIELDEAVAGRYVTVWFTSLPDVGDGFRAEVSEIRVLG